MNHVHELWSYGSSVATIGWTYKLTFQIIKNLPPQIPLTLAPTSQYFFKKSGSAFGSILRVEFWNIYYDLS